LRRLQRVFCPLGAQRESIPFKRYGRNDFLTPLRHMKTIFVSSHTEPFLLPATDALPTSDLAAQQHPRH
jgi:hypothetical protein